MESYMNTVSCFFEEEDYQDFLSVIKGKEDEIRKVDITPIENFNHQIIPSDYMQQFVELYQSFKYYFEKKVFYYPKMQEGIALVISKVILFEQILPSKIDNYFRVGNRGAFGEIANPFEEISRLLLLATKEDFGSNLLSVKASFPKCSDYQLLTYFNLVRMALNENRLRKGIRPYHKDSIIDDIGVSLEESSIDCYFPYSASKVENRELLLKQCDSITELHRSRVEYKAFIGEGIFQERALSRFDTTVVYAKRNIGVYEPTKVLKKKGFNTTGGTL